MENDLIYRSDALKLFEDEERYGYIDEQDVRSIPAVDAVEVVRCRECIHRDPEDHKCDSGQFERAGCVFPVDDDYFCKYGQRREDGDNT